MMRSRVYILRPCGVQFVAVGLDRPDNGNGMGIILATAPFKSAHSTICGHTEECHEYQTWLC